MQNFTEIIEWEGRSYNFYFNRIYTATETRYHVSVIHKDRKNMIFHMVYKDKRWVLLHPDNCPEWVVKLESRLESIILKAQE